MMAPSAEDQNTKFVKYILRTMNITDQNFTLRELVVSDILGTLSMHDHRTVLCKSCSCDSDDIKSATADDMDVSQPESDIMPTPTGCDWVSPEHNPKNILRSIFKTSLLYKPKNEDTLGQKTTDFEEGGGIEKLSVLVRYCIDGLLGENRLSPATCRPAKGRCCPASHFSSATSPDSPVQSPTATPNSMHSRPICPDTSTFLHMPMPSNFDPFAYHLGRGPYFGQMYPSPIEFTKPTQCLAYSDMIPDIVPAMIPTTLPATTPHYVGHAHTMSVVPATSFADGRRSRKRSIVPQTYAAQPRFKMRKTCPSLEVGTKIDAFSVALNQWFPAEIVEVRRGQLSQARLHFRDWGSLWDEWMVLDTGCNRVAELGSESVMTKTNSLMIILLHAVDLLRIMVDIDVRLAVKVANTGVVSHLARFVPLHSSLSFNDELIFGPSIELCITLISKYGNQFNKFGKIYKSRDSRLVCLLQNRCNLPYDVSRIIDMYTPGHSTVMSDILDIIGSVQPFFERILFSKCHRSINDSLRVMYELTYNDEFLRMFFSEMSLRRIAEIIVNPRGQFIDEPIAEAIITLQQVVVATDECTCIDPESVQNRLAPLGIIEAVLRELEQKKGQWFQPRPDRPLLDVLDMIALLFAITRSKENQAVAVQAGCWSVLLDIALHSSQQVELSARQHALDIISRALYNYAHVRSFYVDGGFESVTWQLKAFLTIVERQDRVVELDYDELFQLEWSQEIMPTLLNIICSATFSDDEQCTNLQIGWLRAMGLFPISMRLLKVVEPKFAGEKSSNSFLKVLHIVQNVVSNHAESASWFAENGFPALCLKYLEICDKPALEFVLKTVKCGVLNSPAWARHFRDPDYIEIIIAMYLEYGRRNVANLDTLLSEILRVLVQDCSESALRIALAPGVFKSFQDKMFSDKSQDRYSAAKFFYALSQHSSSEIHQLICQSPVLPELQRVLTDNIDDILVSSLCALVHIVLENKCGQNSSEMDIQSPDTNRNTCEQTPVTSAAHALREFVVRQLKEDTLEGGARMQKLLTDGKWQCAETRKILSSQCLEARLAIMFLLYELSGVESERKHFTSDVIGSIHECVRSSEGHQSHIYKSCNEVNSECSSAECLRLNEMMANLGHTALSRLICTDGQPLATVNRPFRISDGTSNVFNEDNSMDVDFMNLYLETSHS
eukprot:213433_1